jgi:hypothetical protein
VLQNVTPGDIATWAAVLVAVVLGARGGIWRNTIAALNEQNAAYEKREVLHQEQLAKVKSEAEAEHARNQAALKRLGDRNSVLEDLVLGRAELAQIVTALTTHDAEALRRHEAVVGGLQALVGAQEGRNVREQQLVNALGHLSDQLAELNPEDVT